MKRLLAFVLIAGLALSLVACGVTTPTVDDPPENDGAAAADGADAGGAPAAQTGSGGNTLVAYFSWADMRSCPRMSTRSARPA